MTRQQADYEYRQKRCLFRTVFSGGHVGNVWNITVFVRIAQVGGLSRRPNRKWP